MRILLCLPSAPLISYVEVSLKPGVNPALEGKMSLKIKCFAAKGRTFQASGLKLKNTAFYGKWRLLEESIADNVITDDGTQVEFTMTVAAGKEYTFLLDDGGLGGAEWSEQEGKTSMVLHFRYTYRFNPFFFFTK